MLKLAPVLRSIFKEPVYALAFVITLGLGIGANTAIFSLVYGVLLRPLPYPEADRILYLENAAKQQGVENAFFSFPEVADYRDQVDSLDQVVEFGDWTFNVLDRGEPHRAVAGLVTANFFEVLGMRPLIGRTLRPEDRLKGAEPVAVLTYEYWQRLFEGDIGVLDQKLNLTSKVATIVGVLEPGSHYASRSVQDFYANYTTNDHYSSAAMEDQRRHRMTTVLARLAPGATIDQARLELNQTLDRFSLDFPNEYPVDFELEVVVTPWRDELVARARPTLLLLLGAAAFVLLIACANVANLTLARGLRRERELAVHSAMGAGQLRLRMQLFAESLLLTLVGAGLGLLLAYGLLDALRSYTSRFTNRTGEIAIDGGVLTFSLAIAVIAALAFAALPGLIPSKRLAAALAAGSTRSTGGGGRRLLQRALVSGQLAVSFILLVGAGLLVKSLANLNAIDPGYDLEEVLTVEVPSFGSFSDEESRRFSSSVVTDMKTIPSVEAVALTQSTPLSSSQRLPLELHIEGRASDPQNAVPSLFETISPEYFEALGVEMASGRAFSEADDAEAPKVAIINEAAARHYFADSDPLGKRVSYTFSGGFSFDDSFLTIVGVAPDFRLSSIDQEGQHMLYLPEAQSFPGQTVLIRTAASPGTLTPQVIETLRAIDPNRPLERIRTLADVRDESLAPQRLNAVLFSLFAGLALVIAAVGVGAVLAFTINARRRELGIRAALGASPARQLGTVLRDGGSMAILGLAVGAVGALGVTRFLQGQLFGVKALDATTFIAVGGILLLVATIATLLPARSATRTAPSEVLRAD